MTTSDDELVAMLGQYRTVLIGEATHGTEEFHRERAAITQRLIEEQGFGAVAIEGDWPDAARVHRYVVGAGSDRSAVDSLSGFRRFPAWMWRNTQMLDFVGWLYEHNSGMPSHKRCGVYGLDLYSVRSSAKRVLRYLQDADVDLFDRARDRYACLGGSGPDPQRSVLAALRDRRPDHEQRLLAQVTELTDHRGQLVASNGSLADADDAWFDAHHNALVVLRGERFHRTMIESHTASWNLRDRHMYQSLTTLQQQLTRRRRSPKTVVWAHNSHVGDARATDMARRGQLTLGQLVRQRSGDECALVGLTTFRGSVTAARDWDAPAERRHVIPALEGSVEHHLHHAGHDRLVLLPDELRSSPQLTRPMLERAIGVIYRPETERRCHYFMATLAEQFDVVIHLDDTRAVEPLELMPSSRGDEPSETWPFGT